MNRIVKAARLIVADLPDELENAVQKAKNIDEIINIASEADKKYTPELEEIFLNDRPSPEDICRFVRNVPAADVKSLQKNLLDHSGLTCVDIIKFRNVAGDRADEQVLEKALLSSWDVNAKHIMNFAAGAKHADIKALQTAFEGMADVNTSLVLAFAKYAKGADLLSLQKLFIKLDPTLRFANDFISYVPNATVEQFEQAFLSMDYVNPATIVEFARYVTGANIELLQKALLENKDTYVDDIYFFASGVPNANIYLLEKKLLTFENVPVKYLQWFLLEEGADKKAIEAYMKKYKDNPAYNGLLSKIDVKLPETIAYHKYSKDLHELRRYLPISVKDLNKEHPALAKVLKDLITFNNGKDITAAVVDAYEKTLSTEKFNVDKSLFNLESQRSVKDYELPQLVLNLVADENFIAKLKEADLYDKFNWVNTNSKEGKHPYVKDQLGWVRLEIAPNKEYLLVDEVQTDLTHSKAGLEDISKVWLYTHKDDTTDVKEVEAKFSQLSKLLSNFPNIALHTVSLFAKENGIKKIFYHTYEGGMNLKYNEPPKSIYTDVPKQNYFKITENKPFDLPEQFFERQAQLIYDLVLAGYTEEAEEVAELTEQAIKEGEGEHTQDRIWLEDSQWWPREVQFERKVPTNTTYMYPNRDMLAR